MDTSIGFWVAVVVGLLPLSAALLWWWNDCWYALRRGGGGANLPPGYMGLPFVGEMPAFLWYFIIRRRPDDFINAKRRKYGEGIGMYRTYLLGSPTIIACTPPANKFVLQTESSFEMRWNTVELVGATSIIAAVGASHTRLRGLVVRAVNQPDALRKITPIVQPRITSSLRSWSQRGRITVLKEAKKMTLANIAKYFASIETENVLDTLDELVKGILSGLKAYPLDFPGTALHHGLKCRRKAEQIFQVELEKRKKSGDALPKNDLMELLMQMKDEEGSQLTDTEVIENIVTLVIAGYTSTSVAFMWAVYFLAKNPDVLNTLREEHIRLGKKIGELVTYEEIVSCKYTTKVVEEILRMANISPFVVRTAAKDVEYRGCKIPKGWQVLCWLRYQHTNPEYFEDPLCFNPDRWNDAAKPGSYVVFGGGPRTCPGNMFARHQVAILLHHLVLGYRWKLVNPNVGMAYLPHPKPADEVEIEITAI